MKRKFLAKAITLGLMLAVPFGAEAANIELSIDDSNKAQYEGSMFVVYESTRSNETIDGNVNLNINKDGSGTFANKGDGRIKTVLVKGDDKNFTLNGNINNIVNNVSMNSYLLSIRGMQTQGNATAKVNGKIVVEANNLVNVGIDGAVTFENSSLFIRDGIDLKIKGVQNSRIIRGIETSGDSFVQVGSEEKAADLNITVIGTETSNFENLRIQTLYKYSTNDFIHYGNANLYMENINSLNNEYDNISGYWIAKGNTNLIGDVNVTYVATDERVDGDLNQNIYGISVGEINNTANFNHAGNVNVYLAGNAEKMGLEKNTVYGSVVGNNGTYNHTDGLRTLYFGTEDTPFVSSDTNAFKGSFANFDVIKVSKGSSLVLDSTQKNSFAGDQDFVNNGKENGRYKDLSDDSSKLNGITSKGGILNLGNDNSLIVDEGATAKIATVNSNSGNLIIKCADNVKIDSLDGEKLNITTDTVQKDLISIGDNKSTENIKMVADSKAADNLGGSTTIEGLQNLADTAKVGNGNKKKDLLVEQGTVTGEITGATDEKGKVIANSVKEAVNVNNEAISNMASISLMTWRQENNDMNKRLGELRDSKGEHGAWARMARGESKYGAQNIKNQYNYYQVGYDEKLSSNPDWTVGVALTHTEGNSTFTNGSAENKHTGVAVYGSYLKDDGSFIDLIAKYARMKNEFTINGGAGNGDYETNGYSISAEYGKRFTKDNGFWIEPQVELTYGYVGAAGFLSSNGANVRQDGMDSLVGRIGFSLGRDIKAGNVYARASYLYDFDGETDISFSKGDKANSFKQNLGGSWWEVGVGTNINLSDATYLYFDVEKTYGGNVATPWQWNAGVRWSF